VGSGGERSIVGVYVLLICIQAERYDPDVRDAALAAFSSYCRKIGRE
jgi:hypothetical protein